MSVNRSATTRDIEGISFRSSRNMKVCCVFSLESPHTKYNLTNIKRKITRNYLKYSRCNVCSYGIVFCSFSFFFLLAAQERVRTAVLNEPSVFEPLKFYCILQAWLELLLVSVVFNR